MYLWRDPFRVAMSTQRELDVDRHEDRHGLAQVRPGLEAPLLDGLQRFLIEAERLVEGMFNLDVCASAVGLHNAPDPRRALEARAHRFGCVHRLRLAEGNR